MTDTPVIALRDITKTYGEGATTVNALRGVSIDIAHGEYLAIMGASGSGKSTLMHIIGCLDQPTDGQYFLDGVAVATSRQLRARRRAQPEDRVRLPELQPHPAHDGAGQRRAPARLRRRQEGRAARARDVSRSSRSASVIASTTRRTNSRAANSSESRSLARS